MHAIPHEHAAAAIIALTISLAPGASPQITPQITPQTTHPISSQLAVTPAPLGTALSTASLNAQTKPTAVAANTTPPAPSAAAPAPRTKTQLEDLGDLFVVRKRYLDAVNAYQQVTGDSAIVWNKLGVAYQHLFNIKSAKESYEHALSLDPRYAEALNNFGTILYAEKNYSGAARYYKRALKFSHSPAAIDANLGTALFAKGDYNHGAKAYREAFRLDPAVFDRDAVDNVQESGSREARAMLNFHLAKFYAKSGMNARALECLREALDNGFHDRKKLMSDQELADLRATDGFRKLLVDQGLANKADR